jgi:hypothetical protein
VSATANAHAKIYKALTIKNQTALDFATVVLGSGTFSNTITVSQAGVLTCGANVTCSGTAAAANFTLTGTKQASVALTVPATVTLTGVNSGTTLTVNLSGPTSTSLDTSGNGSFNVGGSLTVADTTQDDQYNGQFVVNADYQ